MGSGGSPSGPAYTPLHLDMHAWIMAGLDQTAAEGADPNTWDGMAGLTTDALSSSIGGTPYSNATPFDPEGPDSRYPSLMQELDTLIDDVKELAKPSTSWGENADTVEAKLDSVFDSADITAVVSAHRTQREAELTLNIARYNSTMSAINAVNTSSRAIGIALLERETDRAVSQFEANLELEHEKARRKYTMEVSTQLVGLDKDYFDSRIQSLQLMGVLVEQHSTAQRQFIDDDLKLTIEDVIWDLRIYEFAQKALGSIAGASIIPSGAAKENQTLSTLSMVAGAAGALLSL